MVFLGKKWFQINDLMKIGAGSLRLGRFFLARLIGEEYIAHASKDDTQAPLSPSRIMNLKRNLKS